MTAFAQRAWRVGPDVVAGALVLVRADLVDVAGNIAVSSPVRTITMDRSGSEFADGTHDTLADHTIDVTAIYEDNGVYNNDFYTRDHTLVFSGTSNAPDRSHVAVWLNGNFLAYVEVIGGAWRYDYTAHSLDDGYYKLQADLVDVAGNIAVASQVKDFAIDNSGSLMPDGTHDSLADKKIAVTAIYEDNGVRNDDFYTRDRTLVFSGTSDAPDRSHVAVWLSGNFLAYVEVSGGTWKYDYTAHNLSDGYYYVRADLVDPASNIAVSSEIKRVSIDNSGALMPDGTRDPLGDQAIAITSIVTDTGVSASDFITSATSVTAHGTGFANAWIQVFLDGKYLGNQQIDGSGNWSYGLNTPQGNHVIKAQYIDLAENVVGPVVEHGMTVDTTPPVFTTPANSNVNENTAAGTVIYSAATSDATGVTYAITGGADAAKFSINATTGQVTMNFTPDYEAPVDAGGNNVYDYVITATDTAGNRSTQNASLTVLDVVEKVTATVSVTQQDGGFWVMGGLSNVIKNHFVVGRVSSNVPVTYTTSSSIIKVAPDGTVYTDGPTLPNGRDIPGSKWDLGDGFPIAFEQDPFKIFATSATGDVTVLDVSIGRYNGVRTPAGYPEYSAIYKSPYEPPVPPVALDLNKDGHIDYIATHVDVDGDGLKYTAAWIGNGDGVVVWDKYHDGKVHDSSQYAFAQYVSGAVSDLTGLKAFDTNGNGHLDQGDAAWSEMRVWQDLNGNGFSDEGEVKMLEQWNITSVALTSDGKVANAAEGVQESGKSSAALTDGSHMLVADVSIPMSNTADGNRAVAHSFVLDFNHDGVIAYDKVSIDLHGAGYKESVAWAGKGDGILIWDKYQDGSVHEKSQYSFNSMKIFDTNSDGKLDSRDVLWKQLSVWQDFNGDGASEVGEVKTLSELGFKEINFVSDGGVAQPAAGVIEYGKASVTMNDGSSMVAAQASFSLLDQTQWTQTASAVI